ncbi:MAG: VWA domain-containing protein [Candidatus Diapherotrites archaeon]|uniref:VWA domain-containing protein n=1 Tax=Candidatus Iainarchaeum sp. TaxID=3101447 RepID=A0A8T3YL05_9ARCH|nr:VWA domain-containing protein [Candidatus Diapherotrites archaeon]
MNRAEISLLAFFAIALAAISLFLIIGMASKVDVKDYLCSQALKSTGKRPAFCEPVPAAKKPDVTPAEANSFSKGSRILLDDTDTLEITLPGGMEIDSATFTLDAPFKGATHQFSDGATEKKLHFGFKGGQALLDFTIPADIEVLEASITLAGSPVPGMADLVFIIDTSDSMHQEWDTLCRQIPSIIGELEKAGVDVKVDIFRLGDGTTYEYCATGQIAPDELPPVSLKPKKFAKDPSGLVWTSEPYDDPAEAWALGVAWAAENYEWRENSKRIIFPISDSDPTGGGQTRAVADPDKNAIPQGDAAFTGNEDEAVSLAIERAKAQSTYLFPIYGDDSTSENPEGYHVGIPAAECLGTHSRTCGKILAWMNKAASSTRGRTFGYSDETMPRSIIQAISGELPKGAQLLIGKDQASKLAELPEAGIKANFKGALQKFADSCTSDCTVPMSLHLPGDGSVKASGLDVRYRFTGKNIKVSLEGVEVASYPVIGSPATVDFAKELKSLHDKCESRKCSHTLKIQGRKNNVAAEELKVAGRITDSEDFILERAHDCITNGRTAAGGMCSAVSVSPKFPLSMQSIQDRVNERRLCPAFAMATGCDIRQLMDFEGEVRSQENLIISYDAESGKVRVR